MKLSWKIFVTAILFGVSVKADTLDLKGGIEAWHAAPSGSLRYQNSNWISAEDGLGYENETIPCIWLDLEHTIPFVPNLRLEHTGINYSGRTHGNVAWGPWNYSDNALSELQIKEYDTILYYTLLKDTFWTTLDIGIDLKFIDSRYMIQDDYGIEATYNASDSLMIPQGYLRARVDIPQTRIGVESSLQYISNVSSELYDMRIKADYALDFEFSNLQPAIELGYRKQHICIDEDDYDTKIKIDLGGFYWGAMLRF